MKVIEILLEGALYRCYLATFEPSCPEMKYIVAGVGHITLDRESAAVVSMAPVFESGRPTLAKLAPLIVEAASRVTAA